MCFLFVGIVSTSSMLVRCRYPAKKRYSSRSTHLHFLNGLSSLEGGQVCVRHFSNLASAAATDARQPSISVYAVIVGNGRKRSPQTALNDKSKTAESNRNRPVGAVIMEKKIPESARSGRKRQKTTENSRKKVITEKATSEASAPKYIMGKPRAVCSAAVIIISTVALLR